MRQFFIIIFLLSFTSKVCYGQGNTLFQKSFTEDMELKFRPEYATSSLPNYFIDEIAKALPKIRMYVKINYRYDIQTKVVKKGNKYLLSLTISQINHGGHFKYKQFDFSHLIAPARIEQSFLVKDLSSNTQHKQYVKLDFKLQSTVTVAIDGLKGVITNRVAIDPNGVRYYYDNEQKAKFQQAVSSIDNYYDDALKLDALQKRVEALKYEEAGVVAIRNVDLKYIEKDLAKLQIDNYRNSLNLDSYDPIHLLQKYNKLKDEIQKRRSEMDEKMESLDQINYNEALVKLQDGEEKEAVALFKKSININPYFSPSIYQLSLIDNQHKRYTDCLSKLQHIFNDLKPDLDTKAKSLSLSKTCYDLLMNQCLELNNEERYNQSIGLLKKAKVFCDSTNDIQCDARLEQYITQATYGLYASYLSIANASLKKGRLDMCQDYMKMAKDYKSHNLDQLSGKNTKAQAIMMELIESLVNQSEIARDNGDFLKANDILNQAKQLCQDNPSINCKLAINKKEAKLHQAEYNTLIEKSLYYSKRNQGAKSKEYLSLAMTYQKIHSDYIPSTIGTDTIVGKVRYIMYKEAIRNGKTDLEQKKYEYALVAFSDAKDLEFEYTFKKDPMLATYTRQAAKPIVLDILKKGKLKAWGKYYDEASNLLDSAIMKSQHYDILQDVQVDSAITDLRERLKKNVCDKLNTQYNALIKKANMSLRFEDYHNAASFWRQAATLSDKSINCQLNTQSAKDKLSKYQTDIEYSTELFLADSLISINKKECFQHLVQAENIRVNKSSQLHSSKVKSLIDILFSYNDPDLNSSGIAYFINNEMPNEALKLCMFALQNNQEVKADLINQVATLIVAYDKQNNTDLKLMADKRFSNKKEYKSLKKAYLKASKK